MDFLWFRDLEHLSKTGHFSRAAEMSNISQPAFSRRIKAIETWVGAPLVDRSRHPVSLTSAGLQMLDVGQQALARLDNARREILDSRALPENYVVTFGAQHSIGWRFYPAWLQSFEKDFGPIMSRLSADDLPNCLNDLTEGRVDFVIAYASAYASAHMPGAHVSGAHVSGAHVSGARVPGVVAADGIESVLIGTDSLVPVSRSRPDGTALFDLSGPASVPLPYLRFGPGAPISRHIEPLLAECDLHRRLSVVYENSMAGALRIRARDGIGVAWLPRSLVAPDLESGQLVITGDPGWEVRLEIRMHRLRARTNKLTRAIWAYLSVREPIALFNSL